MLDRTLFEAPPEPAPMIELRDYQERAVQSVFDYWQTGGQNPLVDMATGTGKSLVIAELARRVLQSYPEMRILMLVHVKELVSQNATALLRAWPGAPIGINSAGIGRRDRHSQILYASIQSVFRSGKSLGPRDLVLIDEAHLVPKAGEGMYLTLLEALRDAVPDLRVCGFSATPFRLDSGRLDSGRDRLFTKIVYSYGIAQGVKDGYLSPLVSKGTGIEIDISGVARRGGEFIPGQLEGAANNQTIIDSACDEICERGRDRKGWLAFCAGISHALNVRDALRARGISCETVTADTPNGERDQIFKAYKSGQIRCLTGMNVFTTGFDAPHVDLIAALRPTLSTGLYVQMLGRGTRLASGKENCLVLDFAGNIRRHGPVDQVIIESKGGGAPMEYAVDPDTVRARLCPNCGSYNAVAAQTCVDCGYEWPVQHEAKADDAPVMASHGPQWIKVTNVEFHRHEKFESPPSLRVEYYSGMKQNREWVSFERSGFPRVKAESWWRMFGGQKPAPKSVNEALERIREINRPTHITIAKDGKFWRVTGYLFSVEDQWLAYDEKYRGRLLDEGEEPEAVPEPAPKPSLGAIARSIANEIDDEIPF